METRGSTPQVPSQTPRRVAQRRAAPPLPPDVIAHVLAHACGPSEIAARRWCVNKAWLEAYGDAGLWRTLTLSTAGGSRAAHSMCSAWVRAPQQLRLAVEKSTRTVVVASETDSEAQAGGARGLQLDEYSLGRGLAGQRFARLETVCLYVWNLGSTQSYGEDEAALRPLFGADCLRINLPDSMCITDTEISPSYLQRLREETGRNDHKNSDKMPVGSFLDKRNVYMLCERFQRVRHLDPDEMWMPVYSDLVHVGSFSSRSLLVRDDKDAHLAKHETYLDLERATQLVEVQSLGMDEFLNGSLPDRLFPDMKRLSLDARGEALEELETVFEECARVCPSLEFLTLMYSEDQDTWNFADGYSVFAHVPPTLKALVIALDEVEPPPLARTTSAFVRLIQSHLPARAQVHVIASPGECRLVDDKRLPRAPWAPNLFPVVGEKYSDAALARASFTLMAY